MFALTDRLTLRPGWPEDADALAAAIGHQAVARNLMQVPWPYTSMDAAAFLAAPGSVSIPRFVICERPDGRLVGGIGIDAAAAGEHELGYWLTPSVWGRGYATEAGRAVMDIARALRLPRLTAGRFIDNPASGRVLDKLGFRPSGRVEPRFSHGRGKAADCILYEALSGEEEPEAAMPMAA